jgi:hypothetical protein
VLLRLDEADTYGEAATMAWRYPGVDVAGQKVGRGGLDGNPNPNALLMQVGDATDSLGDNSGEFLTKNIQLDKGDSGGPFYVNGRLLGTASYYVWGGTDMHYVSVPAHLDWILSVIQYYWSGTAPVPRHYDGAVLESFWSTEQVCQYACDSRSDCQAYDFDVANMYGSLGTCQLVTNVSGAEDNSSYHGALHYAGARASRTGAVVGWSRDLVTDSVVHVASDGHVHDLYDSIGWYVEDITGSAPLPSPGAHLTGYRRSDGSSSVIYRSGNQLIELNRTSNYFDTWHSFNFPLAPNTTPVGDPAAYVRADGLSAVLYRTSTGHIVEVR